MANASPNARRADVQAIRALTCALALALPCLASAQHPLHPTLLEDELYGEVYSVVADLQGGDYLLLQMAISNMGPGDHRGICRILHVNSQGDSYTDGAHFDREDWKQTPEGLEIGPCTLRSKESLRFYAQVGSGSTQASVTLELDRPPIAQKPPNHKHLVDSDFYEMELLVPSAKAKATIKRPSKPAKAVTGYGFMTHSRTTALPAKLAKRWVRFRALGESPNLLLVRAPNRGPATGWAWPSGQATPTKAKGLKLARKPGPLFRVQSKTSQGVWTLTGRKLLFRDAPLERYGLLGALLGSLLGNPVTYTYRATLRAQGSSAPIHGIMEVSFPGGE